MREGFIDFIPALIATVVWGFVTGVAMIKSGLSGLEAVLMTLLVYAGSAQLTALPLIESQAPLWLIFVAGFVVNIRFIIFGAALQPYFRHLDWKRRLGLGYLTSDMVFVLFMSRFGDAKQRGTREQLWYYLGIILPGWISWQTASLAGIVLGAYVPTSWSLEFAAILALLALLIPLVNSRPMWACLLTAGVIAWVGQALPLRLGLVAAVLGGVLAGVAAEQLQRHRGARQ
ncbi:AzlC family ABC transporter permease [Alcaligenes sp. SDU_A2]|uniref:AzlC family ABC transporter permease n=1 Tax=Alcaligenes sp. SDU_A2 TaxID=3136634 RepID=UPI002C38CA7A|nr:AzlC family ABC transporter permease [Alcaligenes sp.]HRL26373.1 AzlC family ABC transporter permease [Alcaligenes sp.]